VNKILHIEIVVEEEFSMLVSAVKHGSTLPPNFGMRFMGI